MKMKHAATLLLPLAMALLVTGCTAAEGGDDQSLAFSRATSFESPELGHAYAVEKGHTLMAQILEDGEISREEYQVAFDANLDCREANGWTFGHDQVWNPLNSLHLEVTGSPPPESANTQEYREAEALCMEKFAYINYLFQTTAVPLIDPPLHAYIEKCLTEKRVPFTAGETSLVAMVGPDASNSEDFDAINSCVIDGIEKLYPNIPGYSISF